MGKNLVSIIIVNWNGKKHLSYCLSSLKKINYSNFEVILVDNASSDGSVGFVKKNHPGIYIVENEENLGFAEANNIGAKEAKGEYLLFLNNDTKTEPDFLDKLVKRMEEDDSIGISQSKLLLMDEPGKLDVWGGYLTFTGFLKHIGIHEIDRDQHNQEREIFSPRGACMLIRRNLFKRTGGFDKDFFAYFEETDLAWRVWLAGYRIVYIPQSIVYHKVGATTHNLSFSFIQYHSYKNRICSLIKNLELKNLFLFLPCHLFLCFVLSFTSLFCLKYKQGGAILKAIGWDVRHIKDTLRKRRVVQSQIRRVRDKDIFSRVGAKIPFAQFWVNIKWFVKKGG